MEESIRIYRDTYNGHPRDEFVISYGTNKCYLIFYGPKKEKWRATDFFISELDRTFIGDDGEEQRWQPSSSLELLVITGLTLEGIRPKIENTEWHGPFKQMIDLS